MFLKLDWESMRDSRRNVMLLALCQALFMSCGTLIVASAPLIGVVLAPTPALATVPIGLMFLAVMTFTLPASLLMRRIGRRNGLVLGGISGAVGAGVAAFAIHDQDFFLFAVGMMFIGVFNSFSQYFRFAAADTAEDGFKARAISLVLAGGVVAAFLGPNLARLTRDSVTSVPFVGGFLCVCVLALLCAAVVSRVRIPRPAKEERDGPTRPMWAIVSAPTYLVAVLGATIAYGSMNLVMTSTPLAMHAYGYDFGSTASVIQWHVVGMFAPSFFTGRLINRFGTLQVMMVGAILLCACVLINLAGVAMINFWIALALLGLGWNFLFIGATTLLTGTYTPAEKAKAQGTNDLMVFSIVAITASSSGAIHASLGWARLNMAVLPALIVVVVACLWLMIARRRTAQRELASRPAG